MKDLTALFSPKSVTVIGASRSPEKVGAIVLKNIIGSGYTGKIYPINPNTEEINGLKCFKDINLLPETPDLAVIALPSTLVLETLTQIGEKGIKNAVIFSAGFKEIGEEGEKLENELIDIAGKYGINVLGPNCLGFVNNLCPINVTFAEVSIQPGNLRFISQSGAIASSLFDWCKSTGLGFSEFITLGNKAVISENEVLQYFQNSSDSKTLPDIKGLSNVKPIGLYLESISHGSEFLNLTSKISKNDPIYILKPGKTQAAAKAMQSHTGAIAGEDAVLESVLNQAGVMRCQTLEDFFDLSRGFAWENAPSGPKVAVVSNAGGPAVISADTVTSEGLELAKLDSQIHEQLLQVLPRSASVLNPIDVLGDALADRFAKASEIILKTDQADALIVILTPQIMTQIKKTAESLGVLSKKYQKPIFCSFIGGSKVYEGEQKLNELKIPSFRFPERAIVTVSKMWKFKKHQKEQQVPSSDETVSSEIDLEKINQILDKAKLDNQKTLDNLQASEVISAGGISTPETENIDRLDEAKSFAQKSGFPIALKLSAPGLLHKKQIGGVITDIKDENGLETAWDKLKISIANLNQETRDHLSVQIQKEITDGVEVIIGVKNDPIFGKVLLFGAGGSLAELIADRNLHLLPINGAQAKNLVEKSKVYPLLKNPEAALNLNKLYEAIVRLGNLAQKISGLSDIEINPAIVTTEDIWAVDTKVILEQKEDDPVNVPKFQSATVVSSTVLASKFQYLDFELEKPFIFQPGQYISVKVSEDKVNCYSIAGGTDQNHFNLFVDITPGGAGSKFFENLKTGDKISFLGPFGKFIFNPSDGAKNLLFLATGCGFAPLKCMIEEALKKNFKSLITLYLGLSYPEEIFGKDYFQKLKDSFPNFNYKIVVWKPNYSWQGDTGFITDLVEKDFTDASEVSAYLCGNKNMVENATSILLQKGCPEARIYTEKV